MEQPENRLIIVSNRLPIALTTDEDGKMHVQSGSGGLVTALAPVLRNRGGVWIGWPGIVEDQTGKIKKLLSEETKGFGYKLRPVSLTHEEKQNFYEGFANEVLWPLFHDFNAHCVFNPNYWAIYEKVNEKFANEITRTLRKNDFVWVHDYHLMTAAQKLRDMGVHFGIAFYLHIPFPPMDIFLKLPWRFQILHALLQYDLIGFQTLRDRRNFIQCVRTLIGCRTSGRGQVVSMQVGNHEIRVGAFPVSIDYRDFAKTASEQAVSEKAWYIHEDYSEQQIILGVDRLDYSKGIPERLKAYRNALRRYPEMREKVTLVQVVVPSRRGIPKYASLKTEIEGLVGEINGEFTSSGWVPIHYMFRSLDRHELLAYYRTSEIALVTPLKDGMNLVAKEYCACSIEENGVLILSEFAGAAAEFQKYALLVNPHDIEGIADAIHQAFNMPLDERKSRIRELRRIVRRHNIFWWVDSFLKAAFAKDLNDFPLINDYVPQEIVEAENEDQKQET